MNNDNPTLEQLKKTSKSKLPDVILNTSPDVYLKFIEDDLNKGIFDVPMESELLQKQQARINAFNPNNYHIDNPQDYQAINNLMLHFLRYDVTKSMDYLMYSLNFVDKPFFYNELEINFIDGFFAILPDNLKDEDYLKFFGTWLDKVLELNDGNVDKIFIKHMKNIYYYYEIKQSEPHFIDKISEVLSRNTEKILSVYGNRISANFMDEQFFMLLGMRGIVVDEKKLATDGVKKALEDRIGMSFLRTNGLIGIYNKLFGEIKLKFKRANLTVYNKLSKRHQFTVVDIDDGVFEREMTVLEIINLIYTKRISSDEIKKNHNQLIEWGEKLLKEGKIDKNKYESLLVSETGRVKMKVI